MHKSFTYKSFRYFFVSIVMIFFSLRAFSQTVDSSHLYGLTKSGLIYLINPANADCGSPINPAYAANDTAMEANAIGYDTLKKSFYYFKRNLNDPPEEFISYNIVSQTYTTLASSPITSNVNRGCINPGGTGYYCLDQNSNLCYYDINAGTWTLITAQFVDDSDTYLTPTISVYPSGDMAFDKNGDLWLLYSTGFQYGLCKITGPLPTTAVDTITVHKVIDETTFTPSKNYPFGGIAFSSSGQIYLSTGSPDNNLYLLQNDHSLASIGILSADGAGTDLTSDIFPVTQLPVTYLNFNGVLQNNEAILTWSTATEINNKGFFVERRSDAQTFTDIGFVQGNGTSVSVNNYTFSDAKLISGNNYYRLKQIDLDGNFSYSPVIKLVFDKFAWSILGNPSSNAWVQLQLDKTHNVSIQIISLSGLVMQTINKGNIGAGTYSIPVDMSHYAPGMYMVKLLVDANTYSKTLLR